MHAQVWNDVIEQENGNQLSPWYGEFWTSSLDAGWIYHLEHGWQFALGSSPDDVFLFDQKLDTWLNTNSVIYPVFYDFGRAEFIQYTLGTKDPRNFIGLSSGQEFDDGLVRAPIDDVEFMKGLTFKDQARVAIYFRLLGVDGKPVASPGVNAYTLLENGFALSPFESLQRVTEEPDSIKNYSLLAIDLSGSIRITPGALTNLVEAAKEYVESVMADGTHTIGIAYFANELVLIEDGFTDNQEEALARLEQLRTVIPDDTTTNLHGAFIKGAERLNELDQTIEDLLIRSLVVFTDGQDQAGINSSAAVSGLIASEDAQDNGISFFTIGTGASVDFTLLESFGTAGFWKADTTLDLGPVFDAVAAAVSQKGEGIVLVEYESPKRSGLVSVEVRLDDDGNVLSWFFNFDAFGFTSPLPKIDIGSLPKMLLIDSGVRVNFEIASPLYDQFDHALRIDFDGTTDFGGFSQERPVSTQTADFPMEAIFPGRERTIFNNSQSYQPAKIRVTVKTQDGIVFKQSEPADLQLGEVQSLPIQSNAAVSRDTYTVFYEFSSFLNEYDRSLLESRPIAKTQGGWQYASNSDWVYFLTNQGIDESDTNERVDLYRYNYLNREMEFKPIPNEVLDDDAVLPEEENIKIIDVGTDAQFVLLQANPQVFTARKLYVYDSLGETYEFVDIEDPALRGSPLDISDNGRYIAFNKQVIDLDTSRMTFGSRYDRQLAVFEDATAYWNDVENVQRHSPIEMGPEGRFLMTGFKRSNGHGLAIYDYESQFLISPIAGVIRLDPGYYITPKADFSIRLIELYGSKDLTIVYSPIDPSNAPSVYPSIPLGLRPYSTPWIFSTLATSYDNSAILMRTIFDLREPRSMNLKMAPYNPGNRGVYQLIKLRKRMVPDP